MKIRAITAGAPIQSPLPAGVVRRAAGLALAARDALAGAGYEIQTVRLATPPLDAVVPPGLTAEQAARDALALAREIEAAAQAHGFGYVALGAIDTLPGAGHPDGEAAHRWRALLDAVPEIIDQTQNVFCAATIARRSDGINLEAVRACGALVAAIATQSADGFGNLRFAALANCPPHIPFFPAAYHDGAARLTIGLALEAADVAVDAFANAGTLDDARERLCAALSSSVRDVARCVHSALSGWPDAVFSGVDLSLAPFPADDRSIAGAFERLGLPAFGSHGTLFLSSVLTECLGRVARETMGGTSPDDAGGRGDAPRFGFSGLMLPVLEDSVLAARAAEGLFGVDSLLLYSAVCGLGLDTVPLPGDTSPGELAAIILDVAALAIRLDKPLTARLFPVPGKQAGDPVSWDFPFFAPSRVLPVRGRAPSGILAQTLHYYPTLQPPVPQ